MMRIITSGLSTTIQDQGRFHYRNKGVPVSGVMDAYAVFKINSLLENQETAAVLEVTMTGPTLEFQEPTFIALGGADFEVYLDDKLIECYKIYQVTAGAVLKYGRLKKGFRGYLGIKGGFKSASVLGSRSFYSPLTAKGQLVKGDEVSYGATTEFVPRLSEMKISDYLDDPYIKAYQGPEYGLLPTAAKKQLEAADFTVAKENNRMAYQLEQTIASHTHGILTKATLPGTVQWTPGGKLIVLMKDGQTTGGYPRVLQLSHKGISIMSQKKTGDVFHFGIIDNVEI